jgi:peroxiredoxin
MGLFSNPPPINDDLTSDDSVEKALELRVQDGTGIPHSLGSLLKGNERTILIFIRHHHCGACMSYVTNLSENNKFTQTEQNKTKVIVIGHGSFEGIEWYKKNAEIQFEMYVDESKKVHEAFGFNNRYLGKPIDAVRI